MFWWINLFPASPGDCVVYSLDLRLPAYGVGAFESRPGHGCVSLVTVVCCQGDHCDGGTLVQTSPPDCVFLTVCDVEASTMKGPRAAGAVRP